MRGSLLLLLLLALATTPGCASAAGPPPDRAPLATAADLEAWMEGYALHPEPDRLPEAVALGRAAGGRYDAPPPLLIGFVAEQFRLHPERLDAWADAIPADDPEGRQFLQMTLWLAGTEESSRRLKELRAAMDPRERDGHASWGFDLLRMPLRIVPLAAPPMVEMLWGGWLASGDPALVGRILDAVPWASSRNRDLREVGEAAKASVLARAGRDPRIREILREEAARREGAAAEHLRSLLRSLVGDLESGGG